LLVYHFKISVEYLTTHEDLKSLYAGYLKHPYSLGSTPRSLENLLNRLFWERLPSDKLFKPSELTKVPKMTPIYRSLKKLNNAAEEVKVTAVDNDFDKLDHLGEEDEDNT
jgi:hypothetical protein